MLSSYARDALVAARALRMMDAKAHRGIPTGGDGGLDLDEEEEEVANVALGDTMQKRKYVRRRRAMHMDWVAFGTELIGHTARLANPNPYPTQTPAPAPAPAPAPTPTPTLALTKELQPGLVIRARTVTSNGMSNVRAAAAVGTSAGPISAAQQASRSSNPPPDPTPSPTLTPPLPLTPTLNPTLSQP